MKAEKDRKIKKKFFLKLPVLFIYLFLVFQTFYASASGINNEGRRIMQNAWDSYRIPGNGEIEEFEMFTFRSDLNYTLKQAKENKGGINVRYKEAIREIKYYENDNKIRVSFVEPPELKNTVFIFLHNLTGSPPDRIWGYLPELRKVRRFAPLDGEFMGTVLDFEDITRRLNGENLEDFEILLLREEKIGDKDCYKILLIPKQETSTAYRFREFWVAKNGLPAFLQVKYYYKEEYGGYAKIQKNFGIY